MTKQELIDEVASRTSLSRKAAGDVVDAFLSTVNQALASGDTVGFAGFGKFHVTDRQPRQGVNPRTGERVQIAAARVPRFTPGSGLKGSVRG